MAGRAPTEREKERERSSLVTPFLHYPFSFNPLTLLFFLSLLLLSTIQKKSLARILAISFHCSTLRWNSLSLVFEILANLAMERWDVGMKGECKISYNYMSDV